MQTVTRCGILVGLSLRRFCSSTPRVLVNDLRTILQKHVDGLQNAKPLTASQLDNLSPRRPSDSHAIAVLPLASDEKLRDQYVNFLGFVRFGLILEYLDTVAGWLAYRHNQTGALMGKNPIHHPMAIVTASVDRIVLAPKHISAKQDIVFDGEVSWTGKSSMEITIRLLQEKSPTETATKSADQSELLLEAKFVMVARDPATQKAVAVHPLMPETPHEKEAFRLGEESKDQRLRNTQQSLLKMSPTVEETAILHDLYMQTLDPKVHSFRHRVLPPNHAWMEDSRLKNVIICFPQQRNVFNKVFGGFLMRSAYELAWANAVSFSHSHPITLGVDDIMFRQPVDIGRLLYLSSEICYTKGNEMQVRVHAEVVNLEEGTHNTTNTFYFTFRSGDGKPVRKVMPKSYGDGMLYIAGKRQYDELMGKNG